MARRVFFFDPPERFVAGTVGMPGERTFFLQASGDGQTVSVSLEKLQVRVLAERLGDLLDTVRRTTDADVPSTADEDSAPLDSPVEEEFRVGNMGLAWDAENELCVVEALAQAEDSDVEPLTDTDEGPDALRVRITASMARAFIS